MVGESGIKFAFLDKTESCFEEETDYSDIHVKIGRAQTLGGLFVVARCGKLLSSRAPMVVERGYKHHHHHHHRKKNGGRCRIHSKSKRVLGLCQWLAFKKKIQGMNGMGQKELHVVWIGFWEEIDKLYIARNFMINKFVGCIVGCVRLSLPTILIASCRPPHG